MKYTILLPVDGSEGSMKAIEMAKRLAKHEDARIILLHAVDIRPRTSEYYAYDNVVVEAMKKSAQLVIKDATEMLKGFDVTPVKTIGRAGDEIVSYATNEHVDLIVMATRGLGAVERFFVGSVTTYVLHHSPVPVLSVPMR